MRSFAVLALTAPLMLAALVEGQSAQRRIMAVDGSGGPRAMFNFSSPNLGELREPDFTRRDIHAMDQALTFDEAQRAIVSALHEGYLAALDRTATDLLPEHGEMGMNLPGGAGMRIAQPAAGHEKEAGHGPKPGQAIAIGLGPEGEETTRAIHEAMKELGQEGAPIRIGVRMVAGNGPGPAGMENDFDDEAFGGAEEDVVLEQRDPAATPESGANSSPAAAPAPRVAVSIDTGDQPLSDETRAKLEALAEKIRAQAEKRAENVENQPGAAVPALGGIVVPGPDIETMKARFQAIAKKSAQFAHEKAALRQKFVGDVQASFSAEQGDRWPAFEHQLIRDKTLPKGRLDGERADLIRVLNELKLDQPRLDVLAPILHDYDQAMHAALTQRNQALLEAQPQIDAALNAGEHAQALSIVDRVTALRVAVRALNEQFTETIADRLDGVEGEAFRQAALRASYPRVYRATPALKAFAAARKLDGLAPEVLQAIDEQEQGYDAQLAAVNQTIRAAIRERQPGDSRRNIEQMAGLSTGGAMPGMEASVAPNPVRDAMRRRNELDERTMKQLYSMLAPDQIARLPKLPSHRSSGPIVVESKPAAR